MALSEGAGKLYSFMQEKACYRDRLYFAADATAASALGVSRMSIQRYKREIEHEPGLVERAASPYRKTVCYRILRRPVTQRLRRTTPRAVHGPRYRPPVGSGRTRACGRRRKFMEKHPERIEHGIQRANGSVTPFNAGDAIAVVSDYCTARGIPLAPSVKARIGKGAKALLASKFPPQIVVLACTAALRTGWYGSVESIAQDMMVVQQGERTSRQQYQQHLDRLAVRLEVADSPVWQALRGE